MKQTVRRGKPWRVLGFGLLIVVAWGTWGTAPVVAADEPLRIIAFGAHPDDCELNLSGVALLWTRLGHKVKFVSATNGDIGHSIEAGGPLALRRTHEVEEVAKVLGIDTQVLDIHDGEIMPTLENRRTFIRLIREWNADIVICNRPNDYHPDHRYTSILVQDAAYMVTVPFICPDTPILENNPVFMYWPDRFQKPYPFDPQIVVDIEEVFPLKLKALTKLVSQLFEYGANGMGDASKFFQGDEAAQIDFLQKRMEGRQRVRESWKPVLEKWYGKKRAAKVTNVEAFEICEYGRQPNDKEILRLFPFLPKNPE